MEPWRKREARRAGWNVAGGASPRKGNLDKAKPRQGRRNRDEPSFLPPPLPGLYHVFASFRGLAPPATLRLALPGQEDVREIGLNALSKGFSAGISFAPFAASRPSRQSSSERIAAIGRMSFKAALRLQSNPLHHQALNLLLTFLIRLPLLVTNSKTCGFERTAFRDA